MTKVKVRHGESLEHALRRFNKAVRKAGILQEVRLRKRHEKPSAIKRKKKKERARRIAFEATK